MAGWGGKFGDLLEATVLSLRGSLTVHLIFLELIGILSFLMTVFLASGVVSRSWSVLIFRADVSGRCQLFGGCDRKGHHCAVRHARALSSLLPRVTYMLYSVGLEMLPRVRCVCVWGEGRQVGGKGRKTKSPCRVWAGPALNPLSQ